MIQRIRFACTRFVEDIRRLVALPDAPLAIAAGLGILATFEWAGRQVAQAQHDPPTQLDTATLLVLISLAWGSTLPLALYRIQIRAAAIMVTSATALTLVAGYPLTVEAVVAQVAVAFGANRAGARATTWSLITALVAVSLVNAATGTGHRNDSVLVAGLVAAAAVTGDTLRLRATVNAQASSLELAEAALFEHVARGERARIARELHDVVAHHLSMITVQADLARLTVANLPGEATSQLTAIGDTARDALTEMHRLLRVLRDARHGGRELAPQPGLANINDLIDQGRDHGRSSVRLIVTGPVTTLDPGVELTAYRIIQEALSNARRHAPGSSVDVELRYLPAELRIRVRDHGGCNHPRGQPLHEPEPSPDEPRPPVGHGLIGMKERATSVGGTVQAREAPAAGFVIEAVLPAQPISAEATVVRSAQ